jgi:hypothetical protein
MKKLWLTAAGGHTSTIIQGHPTSAGMLLGVGVLGVIIYAMLRARLRFADKPRTR